MMLGLNYFTALKRHMV